ncbi:hypothetical protein NFJ02_03g104610 [Pycnococcus provasolii]
MARPAERTSTPPQADNSAPAAISAPASAAAGDADASGVSADDVALLANHSVLSSSSSQKRITPRAHVRRLSTVTFPVAAFFWLWAATNCVTKRVPDLGVVSFATVMLAAAYALKMTSGHTSDIPKRDEMVAARRACFWSCAVVAVNYLLGIVLVPDVGFRVYCTIAGVAFFMWGVMWSRAVDNFTLTTHGRLTGEGAREP